MNATEVLVTIALAVQGWTLLEVIALKTRVAVFGEKIRELEAREEKSVPIRQGQAYLP